MKELNTKKINILAGLLLICGGLFISCNDDISVGSQIDEDNYAPVSDQLAFVMNGQGRKQTTSIEFREEGSTELYLSIPNNTSENGSVRFTYNKSVLDAYNSANESQYAAFPENLVTFGENGVATLSDGNNKSNGVTVHFKSGESLVPNTTYVIPVATEVTSGDLKLSEDQSNFLIFLKDFTNIPDINKANGIKIISCMEVNNTNPLNNLCFTLAGTGQYVVDLVILFSANVNYNTEEGRVYVHFNENVQHILDNREKYIVPLQARGMKVILGLLDNHDRASVANLADDTAREFAKDIKVICDTYQLDGIFLDEEYSSPITPPPAGFVTPSYDAAARLAYEIKRAMPDRLMCVYAYNRSFTWQFPNPVDGVYAGDFVDWAIHDYRGTADLSSNYPGLQRSGMALYSLEFAQGTRYQDENLQIIRDGGYGVHMIFSMDPNAGNFESYQKKALQDMARIFFDDELVYNGEPYKKDW